MKGNVFKGFILQTTAYYVRDSVKNIIHFGRRNLDFQTPRLQPAAMQINLSQLKYNNKNNSSVKSQHRARSLISRSHYKTNESENENKMGYPYLVIQSQKYEVKIIQYC